MGGMAWIRETATVGEEKKAKPKGNVSLKILYLPR
jgi:hypothetical protein